MAEHTSTSRDQHSQENDASSATSQSAEHDMSRSTNAKHESMSGSIMLPRYGIHDCPAGEDMFEESGERHLSELSGQQSTHRTEAQSWSLPRRMFVAGVICLYT